MKPLQLFTVLTLILPMASCSSWFGKSSESRYSGPYANNNVYAPTIVLEMTPAESAMECKPKVKVKGQPDSEWRLCRPHKSSLNAMQIDVPVGDSVEKYQFLGAPAGAATDNRKLEVYQDFSMNLGDTAIEPPTEFTKEKSDNPRDDTDKPWWVWN